MSKSSANIQSLERPTVGMGATYQCGSDRYPYTVVKVFQSGKLIVVQRDEIEKSRDGVRFVQNVYGDLVQISLRNNGRWVQVGYKANGSFFSVGERASYLDPSF